MSHQFTKQDSQTEVEDEQVEAPDLLEITQRCEALSAFRLHRLQASIDVMLDDPERIRRLKSLIHVGDVVEYFDTKQNRCVAAIVQDCRRTKVSVVDVEDGARWSLPYTWINVDGHDVTPPHSSGHGLSRAETAIGDVVGFHDRKGVERIGEITKLNTKTVGVECEDGTDWRVAYSLLFRIFDGDSQRASGGQQLLLDVEFKPSAIESDD